MKKVFIFLCLIIITSSLFANEAIQTRLTDDSFIAYDLNHYAVGSATLYKTKAPYVVK